MKKILLLLGLCSTVAVSYVDQTNPCEYLNLAADKAQHMDVGDDSNFRTIVQQNNREIIRACQEYQLSKLREQKANVGDGGQYYNGSWHPYKDDVNY